MRQRSLHATPSVRAILAIVDCPAKCFVRNILRVTPCGSRFCTDKTTPESRKLFEIKNIAIAIKKREMRYAPSDTDQPRTSSRPSQELTPDLFANIGRVLVRRGGPTFHRWRWRGSLSAASRISPCFPRNFCLLCRLSQSRSVHLYPSHTTRVLTLLAIRLPRNFHARPGFKRA